jgi:hypothetical protein
MHHGVIQHLAASILEIEPTQVRVGMGSLQHPETDPPVLLQYGVLDDPTAPYYFTLIIDTKRVQPLAEPLFASHLASILGEPVLTHLPEKSWAEGFWLVAAPVGD